MPNSALIYYHLPKCAGTAVRSLLDNSFKGTYLSLTRPYHWVQCAEQLPKLKGKDICIGGHVALHAHELLTDHTPLYFTFLREPFSRFASYLRYRTLVDGTAADIPTLLKAERNTYKQWLGAGDLNTALARLESFYFVGLQEEFTTSIQFLANDLGFAAPHLDVIKSSARVTLDTDDIRKQFYAHNADDFAIYEYAKYLFNKRVAGTTYTPTTPSEASPKHIEMNTYDPSFQELLKLDKDELLQLAKSERVPRQTLTQVVNGMTQEGRIDEALNLFPVFNELPQSHPHFPIVLHKVSRNETFRFLMDVAVSYTQISVNDTTALINKVRTAILLESMFQPIVGYPMAKG